MADQIRNSADEEATIIPDEANADNSASPVVKTCNLGEVDDMLCELLEEALDVDSYIVPDGDDEEGKIEISGYRVVIPELQLSVREGAYCAYDADEDDYMPDFSVTLIYELDETAPEKYLYWEQDDIKITLYNYFHGERSLESLDAMSCQIELEIVC